MYRTMLSRLALTAFAIAAAGGAAAAHAATDVHVSVVTAAPVVVTRAVPVHAPAPQIVYRQPTPVYDAPPAYDEDWRQDRERAWRRACRAPRWDPNARYMPGERVWRHGTMYVATRRSAAVWNVNSPPEWTPEYWRATDCSPRARAAQRHDW